MRNNRVLEISKAEARVVEQSVAGGEVAVEPRRDNYALPSQLDNGDLRRGQSTDRISASHPP